MCKTSVYRIAFSLASVALLLSGCNDSSSSGNLVDTGPTPFDLAAASAKAASEAVAAAAEEDPALEAELTEVVESQAAYQAPFPDRTNLFEPRKVAARSDRQTVGESTDSVVLMGFANLGQPQVLLAVDGLVKPLALDEEAYGVRVISIEPPRAVLQRGRSRWTASIE